MLLSITLSLRKPGLPSLGALIAVGQEADLRDRSARNGKPIEVLGMSTKEWIDVGRGGRLMLAMIGTYDPIPKAPVDGEGPGWKDIKLDSTRTKYWLGVGAQPSDSAWRLLSMVSTRRPKTLELVEE
jgi:ribosomal protein S16